MMLHTCKSPQWTLCSLIASSLSLLRSMLESEQQGVTRFVEHLLWPGLFALIISCLGRELGLSEVPGLPHLQIWPHSTWHRTDQEHSPSANVPVYFYNSREGWHPFLFCWTSGGVFRLQREGRSGRKGEQRKHCWLWSFLPWRKYKLHKTVLFFFFLHLSSSTLIFLTLFLKTIFCHKRVKNSIEQKSLQTVLLLFFLFLVPETM